MGDPAVPPPPDVATRIAAATAARHAVFASSPAQKYAPLAAAARFAGLSIKTLERRIRMRQLEVYHVGKRRLVELDG